MGEQGGKRCCGGVRKDGDEGDFGVGVGFVEGVGCEYRVSAVSVSTWKNQLDVEFTGRNYNRRALALS